jgi:hypothetical protein
MGTEGPPELTAFLIQREFWKELGWTRDDLENRPRREVSDYALFITLIRREEQVRAARARAGR